MKSFKDISLDITEEEYRADPALSYSLLAKYERGGFNSIPTLFDKVESPSLTLGQAVDSIITGGTEEFESRFFIADFPEISDTIVSIIKWLFDKYKSIYTSLSKIPNEYIIEATEQYQYYPNWKPETRAKVIKEKGEEYYNLLYLSDDKTILSNDTYNTVLSMVEALKGSEATRWYFQDDNPFENIERCYQLKFKHSFNDIDYRCMADLLIVNHNTKEVTPIDLKTSYKHSYDFHKSFVEWSYAIQSRLYFRIIRANMDKDDYFKDFKLLDYRFIVVSKDFKPLVWECPFTRAKGTLNFGKNNQIEMRDPFEIGEELSYYLSSNSDVPVGINKVGTNDLRYWLNKL